MSVYKEKGQQNLCHRLHRSRRPTLSRKYGAHIHQSGEGSPGRAQDGCKARTAPATSGASGRYCSLWMPPSGSRARVSWRRGQNEIEEYNLRHLLSVMRARCVRSTLARLTLCAIRNREDSPGRPQTALVSLEPGTLRAIFKRQGMLGTAFSRAMKSDQVKLALFLEGEQIGRAISYEEEAWLLSACSKSRSRSLRPLVELALQTGARYGTLRMLRRGNIDFARRTVKFGKDKTKTSSNRALPR